MLRIATPTIAMLVLLSLASVVAEETPLRSRIREEIARALAHVDLAPDDLVVRDERFWKKNEGRLREMGALVGDVPLPRDGSPLHSPLVRRVLRSPLAAVALGADLLEGRLPAELVGLASPPDANGEQPRPSDAAASLEVPDLVRRLAVWLDGVEAEVRTALPEGGDDPRLAAWMLDSVPRGEVKAAREVLDRWQHVSTSSLARRIRAFAHGLRATPAGSDWPVESPRACEWKGRRIVLGTAGNDVHEGDAWLIVDPGGSDIYRNNAGGTRGFGTAALCLDLGGDDRYETDAPFSQGAARCGAGILIDLLGDDTYVGNTFCQAATVGGVGILADLAGRDSYTADRFAQSAAGLGTAVLDDAAGNDVYRMEMGGQGFARTAATAVLRDAAGDDRYLGGTRYESMYSRWTGGRKVHWSWLQGCSLGFYLRFEEPRVDGTKGLVIREMFPGGVGVLVDERGDDEYVASMYGQGTAYFYGLGILVDRRGADRYVSTWYGQGAAPHFAVGILADGAGNDAYSGMHQVQGNGRDFSTGVLIDAAGNDRYVGEDRVQGCGDLRDGYGIFVDLSGDDRYEAGRRSARGFATMVKPADQPTETRPYHDVGLFLDLAGKDAYAGKARGADGTVWVQKAVRRGVGVDRER
jgi:hypothetical protein